jgi:hypothetical protein
MSYERQFEPCRPTNSFEHRPLPPLEYNERMTECPKCHAPVPPEFYFCPHCGAQIKEQSLSVSLFTQTWIYVVSVLLPPLGFWPGIKYFKNPDPKAKQIGEIAIILSVVATVVTVWLTFSFVNDYVNTLNQAMNGLY